MATEEPEGGYDLAALVKLATSKQSSRICWAKTLGGPVLDYLSALDVVEKAEPGKVNRRAVQRTLEDVFGVSVSSGSVQAHFRRECMCPKR